MDEERAMPVVVIGAGAAGLTAAIFAATGPRKVVLLERTADGGRKILISGGGRCNVLPSELSPDQYVTASSPNTLKKMLRSWPLAQQRVFFEDVLGVELALEPESGKLFPVSNRARDVRDALVRRAEEVDVELRMGATVTGISRAENGWHIDTEGGRGFLARAVVVATGGLSVPQTGSDGFGLRVARELGHGVHDTYPALTPLTASPHVHAALAGVSLPVRLAAPLARGSFATTGGFLITHRGYSGPSVLNVSHLAVEARRRGESQPILVQWTELESHEWEALLVAGGDTLVGSLLRRRLPDRLADRLLEESGVASNRTLAQLRREERTRLVGVLARYPLPWTGDEGYKKAEVTGGGVALAEVDPRTMESRIHPGLYLCGEVLDAFGPIGGYNFAWAWATGRAAGLGVATAP